MQMSLAAALLWLAASETPVEAVLLDGQSRVGLLQQLSESDVQLLIDGQSVTLSAGEFQQLSFPDADAAAELDKAIRTEVELVDRTTVYCTGFVADSRTATLQSPVAGEFSLPLAHILSVRLGEWDSAIDEDWRNLRQRESRQDLLVVRKEDDLDFASGVVGEIGPQTVTVLLGERELEVPRDRVFGFVFPRERTGQVDAVCSLLSDADDLFRLQTIELRDDAFTGTLIGGTQVRIPVDRVQSIDFGLDRIRYLTEMEATATYESVGAISREYVLKYRRVEFDEDPLYPHLVIGRQTYKRGLWIHSGSVLRYRLNREFRRLQAVMGMNRSSYSCAQFNPSVRVQFLTDGQLILDEVLTWSREPQDLDIDVEGVRDLEIRVMTTEEDPLGICEHLGLAEARVIK